MPRRPAAERPTRATARLTRDAILGSAIGIADTGGLEGLSMRGLAQELEVNPMSLYHHVADKDALLEAMLDVVVAQIPVVEAAAGGTWADELRTLIWAARRTMLRHPWAVDVVRQQETPTPATLAHLDRVVGVMLRGGCSIDLCHHALHVLGSRVLGFSDDLFDDSPDARTDPAELVARMHDWPSLFPNVVALAHAASHDGGLGGCDDDREFDFALDILLEGLERRRVSAR
ncbi:MAG: TetR/AcrR family transcriptional regulator C-terminal domain-containing protein [Propionibacteriaceae bacterium]|nr:TetR/AcrR family transcriptional regulator C-terminal domain-containing protein [Propionibacteriaceae bacterium]